jgi:hypothetical protein
MWVRFLLFLFGPRQARTPAFGLTRRKHRRLSSSCHRSGAQSSIAARWDLACGAARIRFAAAAHILSPLRLKSKKSSSAVVFFEEFQNVCTHGKTDVQP